jgi:MoaA/NifB/PqqE/SkfB family radical SAM enzyme
VSDTAPLFVSWMCTRRCTLRCAHCYVRVTRRDDRSGEVETARAIAFIDELADSDVCLLSFGGAEPLLREDFFELATHARSRGLTIVTCSNGMPIEDDTVARLKAAGFRSIQISLDGSSAPVHEALRGPGSFAPAVRAIERCLRGDLAVTVATAIHKMNLHDVEGIAALAERLGAASLKIQPVLAPGHRLSGPRGGLSPREAMEASAGIRRRLDGSGIRVVHALWAGTAQASAVEMDCSNGFEQALVFEDGSVGVCEGEPGTGSAFDGRFLASWREAVCRRREASTCACTPFIESARRALPLAS